MYGDDRDADQAREGEAVMTKLRGGEGSITAREALSKLMAGEPAPAAADTLVRRNLLSTSRSVLDTMLLEVTEAVAAHWRNVRVYYGVVVMGNM